MPAGVSTATLTSPGPEITPVFTFTVNFFGLTTVALMGLEPIRTWVDETKLLPVIVSMVPFCTCVKGTVAGEIEPITGAGRELAHSGLNVLLQPTIGNQAAKRQSATAETHGRHSSDGNSPGWLATQPRAGAEMLLLLDCSPSTVRLAARNGSIV